MSCRTTNFLVSKFCGNAGSFQTRKLGEISVFYAVIIVGPISGKLRRIWGIMIQIGELQ